jgi:predicted naringenin-chalcone synthase
MHIQLRVPDAAVLGRLSQAQAAQQEAEALVAQVLQQGTEKDREIARLQQRVAELERRRLAVPEAVPPQHDAAAAAPMPARAAHPPDAVLRIDGAGTQRANGYYKENGAQRVTRPMRELNHHIFNAFRRDAQWQDPICQR